MNCECHREFGSHELWRPTAQRVDYEVSDRGRVRSARGVLSPTLDSGGYPTVKISRKTYRVGVIVLDTFVGPRPDGMQCCHSDGNPAHNCLDNLRWDTAGGNRLDDVRNGKHLQARKTHCKRGHPLVPGNLVASQAAKGIRDCLACRSGRDAVRDGRASDIQSWADSLIAPSLNKEEM